MLEDKLYRYRPYNVNTLSEIVNNVLWHSHVRLLNDPFEHSFKFNWSDITQENLVKVNQHLKIIPENDLINFYVKGREKEALMLLQKVLEEQLNKLGDHTTRTFVCCFSRSNDDPLMWAHYANGMTGLCIIYNKSMLQEQKEPFILREVRYNNKIEKISYRDIDAIATEGSTSFDFPTGDMFKRIDTITSLNNLKHTYQKHKRWEYEGEVRRILFATSDAENEKAGLIESIPEHAIEGVIVGFKMHNAHRKVVISLCKEKGIPVYVATPVKSDYSVIIKYEDITNIL